MFQKLTAFYQSLNYWGRIGLWGLLVAIPAIILYLVFLAGTDGLQRAAEFPRVTVLAVGDRANRVQIGTELGEPVYAQYQPLSSAVRDQVVQLLGEFRGKYKQLRPVVTIESDPQNDAAHQVAKTLAQMLARYNLGQLASEDVEEPIPERPMALWCSPGDLQVTYALLSAIAPYIQGELAVIKDPDYSTGKMKLQLGSAPRFYPNGSAVFD